MSLVCIILIIRKDLLLYRKKTRWNGTKKKCKWNKKIERTYVDRITSWNKYKGCRCNVAESLSELESMIIDRLPDKFMRCSLNPFIFSLLVPFCHRLMEQCFERWFYSMESNCQIETLLNYVSTSITICFSLLW